MYLYLPNGELLGTIEGNGVSTSTYITHTDHLGGTNVTSDKDGNLAQLTNYYPYGAPRQNEKIAGFNEQKKYIGQFYDEAVALSYLNARYYDGSRGQFLSEDPMFLEIGIAEDGKTILTNPQELNSYSYAKNNPVIFKDPTGKWWEISGSAYAAGRAFSGGIRFDSNGIDYFMSGGVGIGGGGGVEVAWAPGVPLSHENEASVSVSGEWAEGLGLRGTQNLYTYSPDKKKAMPIGGPAGAVVIGAGGGFGVQYELSSPLYVGVVQVLVQVHLHPPYPLRSQAVCQEEL